MECLDGGPQMLKKRIAVYHPSGNMGDNPNLTAMIQSLLDVGLQLDYIHHPTRSTHSLHDDGRLHDIVIPSPLPLDLPRTRYALVIGIDDGVMNAARIRQDMNVPLVFLSYENFFQTEAGTKQQLVWVRHIQEASRFACFAISQDPLRATSLKEEYGLNCSVLNIPVGGEGVIPYARSSYLREHCGIPPDRKILLHMGSVEPWAMADWLARHAVSLPNPWVLVLHGRYGLSEADYPVPPHDKLYYSCIQMKENGAFHHLVQSADCCAALYHPCPGSLYTGRNIAEIGLASTKMASALQHGVPVLVNDLPLISDTVRNNGCGWVIDTQSSQPFLCLQKNSLPSPDVCHNTFQKIFDFTLYKKEFISHIIDIANTTPDTNIIVPYHMHSNLFQDIMFSSDRRDLCFLVAKCIQEIARRSLKMIKRLFTLFKSIH